MSMVPRFLGELEYAGKVITESLDKITSQFSYSDPDGGESDTFSITLADTEKKWAGPWYPKKGDRIDVALLLLFWNGTISPPRKMVCGSFTLDKVGLHGGKTATLAGVSKPAKTDFTTTDRTKTWTGVTLEEVAQDVAGQAGLTLHYDAGNIPLAKEEQSGPDADFLKSLCERYGLRMKVYRDKLVIFDRAAYKKKPPAMTFGPANRELGEDWDYDDNLERYTGVELTYTNADGEEIKYTHGDDERMLFINQKADNDTDAERIALAALEKENHGCTTISFTTRAQPGLCASQTIRIAGTQTKADGTYYVDNVDTAGSDSGLVMNVKGSKI